MRFATKLNRISILVLHPPEAFHHLADSVPPPAAQTVVPVQAVERRLLQVLLAEAELQEGHVAAVGQERLIHQLEQRRELNDSTELWAGTRGERSQ